MNRPLDRLLPLLSALALALGAAGPVVASLDDQAVYSANAGGRILKLDFTGGTSTIVNADAALHHRLDGLVVRDDLRAIHVIVTDRRGQGLFYSRGGGVGPVVPH